MTYSKNLSVISIRLKTLLKVFNLNIIRCKQIFTRTFVALALAHGTLPFLMLGSKNSEDTIKTTWKESKDIQMQPFNQLLLNSSKVSVGVQSKLR